METNTEFKKSTEEMKHFIDLAEKWMKSAKIEIPTLIVRKEMHLMTDYEKSKEYIEDCIDKAIERLEEAKKICTDEIPFNDSLNGHKTTVRKASSHKTTARKPATRKTVRR